jgi:serine/threonine protein kinase
VSDAVRPGYDVVPGYEVVAHLKRTLSLDVYDVWSRERHALCIVKTIRPDRLGDTRARRGLAREARLLASFTHPHIVRLYEHVARPQPALVLETLQGATLARLLDDLPRRRLPARELGWLAVHLCSALQYIHARGVVHLDLKPSNVISDRGQAKLIDFSIARAPGRQRRGVGTLRYMAPEQRRGGRVDSATDVWGLGAVLFEAATGERPAVAGAGLDGRRLPAPVKAAIAGALSPHPRSRPTVAELEAALEPLAGD